jgi:rare lipoprotein A
MKSIGLFAALLVLLSMSVPDLAAAGVTSRTKTADGKHPRSHRAMHKARGSVRTATGLGLVGLASYYQGRQRVASGGYFNSSAMTAAHRTLPFGTRVRVTHQGSGRSVDVRINDRGPFIAGRIIDLSKAAAHVIGMTGSGIARVSLTILGR